MKALPKSQCSKLNPLQEQLFNQVAESWDMYGAQREQSGREKGLENPQIQFNTFQLC